MKFSGNIIDGKLTIDEKEKFKNIIDEWNQSKVVLDINKWRKPRSNNQNAYYWYALTLLEETGYTKNEWHEFFKLRYNPKIITIDGIDHAIPSSTTKMKTDEFTRYMDEIKSFALQKVGIRIPDANEIPAAELERFYNMN